MRTKKHFILLALALAVLTLAGCHRRDLDYPGGALRIVLDNDYTLPYRPLGIQPYHYAVLLYENAGAALGYEDKVPVKGGLITARRGVYDVMVYSLDNTSTRLDGRDSRLTLRAYTEDESEAIQTRFSAVQASLRESISKAGLTPLAQEGKAGFENEAVIVEPNPLFGGKTEEIDIPQMSLSDDPMVIPVRDSSLLEQGRLTILGVTNSKVIAYVRVFLTNLCRAKYIYSGERVQEPATISFLMESVNEERISTSFNFFGKLDDDSMPNTAYILIYDTGGQGWLFVQDVTSQLRNEDAKNDITVTLDFDIPDPKIGSGFQPSVGEWNEVWYDVPLG